MSSSNAPLCSPVNRNPEAAAEPGPDSIHLWADTSRDADSAVSIGLVATTREKLDELNAMPHGPEPDVHRIRGEFPEDSKRYRVVDLNYYVSWRDWRPAHLLDHPAQAEARCEGCHRAGEFLTRFEAMAEAARRNAIELAAPACELVSWFSVIEIGNALPYRTMTDTNLTNGVGYQEATIVFPVRLIEPTREEIAQYGEIEADISGDISTDISSDRRELAAAGVKGGAA